MTYVTEIRQRGGSFDVDVLVRPKQEMRAWFIRREDAEQFEAVAKQHGADAWLVWNASYLLSGYGHFVRDWHAWNEHPTGVLKQPLLGLVRDKLEDLRDEVNKLIKAIDDEVERREDLAAEAAEEVTANG